MIKGLICAAAAAAFLSGCASTNVTGYSDPAYASKTYQSTVIYASNSGLERAAALEGGICQRFEQRGVKCAPFRTLFSPTRQHTPESVFAGMQEKEFDSLIVLSEGGDYSASEVFGYQSYGSGTAYGNSVNVQASSYALRAVSRQSHMRVTLVDAQSRETAWLGDAKTEGRGYANVTDNAFASSLSDQVVNSLLNSPHF